MALTWPKYRARVRAVSGSRPDQSGTARRSACCWTRSGQQRTKVCLQWFPGLTPLQWPVLRGESVEFRLLGPLEVRTDDGRTSEVAGAHQRALLATLVLNSGRTISTKALITELWGADEPGDPLGALYAHLSRLRHSLAGWRLGRPSALVTKQDGYQFWMGSDEFDVTGFREMRNLAASTARDEPMAAAVLLRKALGAWRGAALQDAAYGPVCRAAAARLEQERIEAYELLIDSELAVGRPAAVIGEVKELLTTQPLHEGLYLRLMTALQMSNRVGEALAVYQQARRVLTEQLGVEPSPVLQQCLQSLLGEQRSRTAGPDVTPTWVARPKPQHAPSRFLLLTERRRLTWDGRPYLSGHSHPQRQGPSGHLPPFATWKAAAAPRPTRRHATPAARRPHRRPRQRSRHR